MFNNENLLEMNGKNPGDYGRRLLRVLYSEVELKTSMLPSSVSDRYLKPKLDEEKFALLNSKFRRDHLFSFYKAEDHVGITACNGK
jgi:hypothetical protein